MHSPILITGAARSGTSMIAGIINICGAFGGSMTGSTPYNKKGQFENSYIRDRIVKTYLRSMGLDPLAQYPLPNPMALTSYASLKGDVEGIMRREGHTSGAWFYKGAKMCLLWPIWRGAFPEAQWIIVRRKSQDIAESCMRTPFMRAFKSVSGWLKWEAEHRLRFMEMVDSRSGMNVTEVWSEDIVNGNFDVIKDFVEQTEGLTWQENEIKEFITPQLWKGGK